MEVDEAGRLLAVDPANVRVAVFDTSGAVLDHWRLPYGRAGRGRLAIVPIPEGQTLLYLNPPLIAGEAPRPFPRPIYVRLDRNGEVGDTVFAPARMTEECPTLDDPYFGRGFWRDLREPFVPKVKWTAGRNGEMVLGCPAEYQIDRVQPDGRVIRILHERDPMAETMEARTAFVESSERSAAARQAGWRWQGPLPPEQKPYYHQLIVGRNGRLWVWPGYPRESYQVAEFPGQTYWRERTTGAFDVFEQDGRYLGPVLLPEGAAYEWYSGYEAPFFAGDTVWLVRRDSLDVQYIDRMIIEWPTGGSGSG